MAIEVISDGPVDRREQICPKCRFKLAYTPADVQSGTHHDYGGGSDTVYWIICPRPQCGERISLSYERAH